MENKVSRWLFVIGILTIVFGGGIGLLWMTSEFAGVLFLISAVVSGVFVLGFSEVIKLLDEINKKLDK